MRISMSHTEYAFDIKMNAAVRVRAATKQDAIDLMQRVIDCLTLKAEGERWTDGSAIRMEASMDDCNPHLYEVDGVERQ